MKNYCYFRKLKTYILAGRAILLLTGVLFLASAETGARPKIKDSFMATYPGAENTQLDTLPSNGNHCGVCHWDFNGGGDRNPYGLNLEAIGGLNKEPGITNAILAVANLDPDADGLTSYLEITAVGYANIPTFPGLSSTNYTAALNVDFGDISPYLTPTTSVDNTPPSVTVISPDGGEGVTANQGTTVTWSASDASGIVAIRIYLSLDSGATYKPVALALPHTGTHTWFPANRPTTQARIRIEAVDGAANVNADESDADFQIISPTGGLVDTTLRDFDMPGTQPFEGGPEQSAPENCAACHGNYDVAVEPYRNWQGSMMALASLDPLFEANMAIANQDAPDSGDLCLRCHLPNGWLQGRSVPTDGSAMLEHDAIGVSCDMCHRMVNPVYEMDISPERDLTVLGDLSFPDVEYGNGMFVVDPSAIQRGPFDDAAPPHLFNPSPFHQQSAFCGTCHDVSNPAFNKDENGVYAPNGLDVTNDDFSAHSMAPVERTFSEWNASAYNTPLGVYAPQFAGNKPGGSVSSCQDCHMRDVYGYGANVATNPGIFQREDMPLHDMTGGSTWLPPLIAAAYPEQVSASAVAAGVTRATYMLQNAADLTAGQVGGILSVRVTNQTGHKLPTGYPEGRRIWINVQFYDAENTLLGESGAYDPGTGVLTRDLQAKVYEVHPGIGENITALTGLPEGPSLHFVLNNEIFEDNRIPPKGFTNAAFAAFGGAPVGHHYDDNQHWDDTPYSIPPGTARAEVSLYYQSTSKEFVEFLRDENTTNSKGLEMFNLWNDNGKCPPELMGTTSISLIDPLGDSDSDGLTYIEEHAYGSDPALAASAHRPHGVSVELQGSLHVAMQYICQEDLEGAVIIAEVSDDLVDWHSGVEHCVEVSRSENGDATETVIVRALAPMAPNGKQFMRLRVEPR